MVLGAEHSACGRVGGPPGVAGLIQIPPAAAVIRRDSASIW